MDVSKYENRIQKLLNECEALAAAIDPKAPVKLDELKDAANQIHDNDLLGTAYFLESNWLYDRAKYDECQRSIENAVRCLIRCDDYPLLARCYSLFAGVAVDNDAYDVAYNYYISAMRFIDEDEDRGVSGILISNLARLYYEMENYRLAANYFAKGIDLVKKNSDDPYYYRNLVLLYTNASNNSIAMSDYRYAEKSYKSACEIIEDKSESLSEDVLLLHKLFEGIFFMIKGETERAVAQIKETLLVIKDDNKLNLYIYDIKDVCMHLFARKYLNLIGEILDIIREDLIKDSSPIGNRILNDIEVDYYDGIKDKQNLYYSLKRQQRITRLQRESRISVYRNSIRIIGIIEDYKQERS